MKLTPVNAVPQRGYHRLQELIDDFVAGDADVVRVEFSETDYKSAKVARSCLGVAAMRSKHNVKVWLRGNQVFLSKVFA